MGEGESVFWLLTDDIVLNILTNLEDDPRHWARLACVSTRFSSLVRNFCWKNKCSHSLPSDLLSDSPSWSSLNKLALCCPGLLHAGFLHRPPSLSDDLHYDAFVWRPHLASENWNLRREQGSKLLARKFRDDCLYICDWPGCVHFVENRNYMLFRGVFKNFKGTRVWRTINDGKRMKVNIGCAFCTCAQTWDLRSSFCLRRGFGYHHDGEPVVRAYVCENGHVSGAWTNVTMFS
ncbi:phytochrome A-associated F-box protein-like [Gastrolobium bilobum]|uniref:phytochrome A-associated F-box protein-like n=1 Tax=Gastrolobium bilobum TaxID=150636 RepID=UPI002AB14F92|nr:phytochrome A-associated F-box protein-like [Gastrolobium bilobum]XP_061347305.1 phytochrome A-associated F-box protein-like [Gastrolobium bilobum]XP_061347306.1 phytochrome A-associated F-box protein-like [Gastrolobium bilobum]XP_061347307.1 phytochrome A-associated F-box protein-like [Gastrolobium bilobum]